MQPYWRKQTVENPLFPGILWSRPENRQGAGKLAIIGGNAHAFSAPGIAYNTALETQAGAVKVLLPIAVKRTVKLLLPDACFGPSNPSGSFSKQSLAEMQDIAEWSDCVLIAGDLGRNSETATLLESFVTSYSGPLVITQDAADYFKETPRIVLERPRTIIVITLSQLQRMFINVPLITPITFSMTLPQLAAAMSELTTQFSATVVTKHNDTILCANNGQVTSTPNDTSIWRVIIASRIAVYYMQSPNKPLETATTALV